MTVRQQYVELKRRKLLCGSVASCVRKREVRDNNRPLPSAVTGRILALYTAKLAARTRRVIVRLGPETASRYVHKARTRYPRYQEWSQGARAVVDIDTSWQLVETGSNQNWHKRSTFRRGVLVRSFAVCPEPQICFYTLGDITYTLKAPRGYHWLIATDCLTLRRRNVPVLFPNSDHLLSGMKVIMAGVREAAKAQVKALRHLRDLRRQRERKARLAEMFGVLVCYGDFISLGCADYWRARDENVLHIRPTQLLRESRGLGRMMDVLDTAIYRHTQELERGWSDLKYHIP